MAPDTETVCRACAGMTAFWAFETNPDAALTALVAMFPVLLFVFIIRSFDDRDLDPR